LAEVTVVHESVHLVIDISVALSVRRAVEGCIEITLCLRFAETGRSASAHEDHQPLVGVETVDRDRYRLSVHEICARGDCETSLSGLGIDL
jgi:hypothetical protein